MLAATVALVTLWVVPGHAQSLDPARADTRIAFSPRLGIEVLGASKDWCGTVPDLHVVAERRATFDDAALATLLQRLGAAVIAHDCPAAQSVAFAGTTRQEPGTILWRGTAAASDGWAVIQGPVTEGAVTPGAMTQGTVTQGTVTQGMATQEAVMQKAMAVAKPEPAPVPVLAPVLTPVPPAGAARSSASAQRERLAALADAATVQVRAAVAVPGAMPGVPATLAAILSPIAKAAELAPGFAAEPQGGDVAARLQATGLDVARSRATAQLPRYLADLAGVPPTRAAAVQLALAAVMMARSDATAPGVLAPLLAPTLRAAFAARDGACAAAAAASGISTVDAARPMLVGADMATYERLLCRLQDAGIQLVSDERATLFSKERDEVLKLAVPASMPPARVAQLVGLSAGLRLEGVAPAPPPADPFVFAPLRTVAAPAPGPRGAMFKLWLRTSEVQPGVSALVGVKVGDDANPTPLSVADWQQWTQNLVLLAGGMAFDAPDCAQDRAAMPAFQAAQALLACPRPAEMR